MLRGAISTQRAKGFTDERPKSAIRIYKPHSSAISERSIKNRIRGKDEESAGRRTKKLSQLSNHHQVSKMEFDTCGCGWLGLIGA